MDILVVEDDDFKSTDLSKLISEVLPGGVIYKAASVTSALRLISSRSFPLIVLDMSLPTFDLSGPGGGGSPQAQGGIEVIRLARRLALATSFIVVTQYPDIEVDGVDVQLPAAAKSLSQRFSAKVSACIHYEFDSDGWRETLRLALVSVGSGLKYTSV